MGIILLMIMIVMFGNSLLTRNRFCVLYTVDIKWTKWNELPVYNDNILLSSEVFIAKIQSYTVLKKVEPYFANQRLVPQK